MLLVRSALIAGLHNAEEQEQMIISRARWLGRWENTVNVMHGRCELEPREKHRMRNWCAVPIEGW